ncbi:MAG: hypothetical protein FWD68_17985 [Alphaproteobacteria bacterium]|nr:hypothetical protein [Alphaproteobacteria bacterium]
MGNHENDHQAVILIHGIGEQKPMQTLRGFVDAVLEHNPKSLKRAYYSKPDFFSDNFELRRLVTTNSSHRTDFFELYWAHLMPPATWGQILGWYWNLIFRNPFAIPGGLLLIYGISWLTLLALLVIVCLGLWTGGTYLFGHSSGTPFTGYQGKLWAFGVVMTFISHILQKYVGDAAIYLSARPPNIEARQKIRTQGLELLDRIHKSGRYSRIIIAAHSLGTVIGYDILTLAWQRRSLAERRWLSVLAEKNAVPEYQETALDAAETTAANLANNCDWCKKARALDHEQRRNSRMMRDQLIGTGAINPEQIDEAGLKWLVTDFITMGSPLTYAALLLANDKDDFDRRAREQELPLCPPYMEHRHFSFQYRWKKSDGTAHPVRLLTAEAPFATTVWTNLYFPSRCLIWGDLIGGPLHPLFGPGVTDVAVKTGILGFLAHTRYWSKRDPLTRIRQIIISGKGAVIQEVAAPDSPAACRFGRNGRRGAADGDDG